MPLLLSLLVSLAAPRASGDGVSWKPGFGLAPLWNDGNAEVSRYEARDVELGIARASTATLIVVAEDLLPGRLVKPDAAPRGVATRRVLKLNHVRSVPAGVLTFQQMLSAFLGADRLDPVKLTVASHEWCGNTYVEWRSDRSILSLRSYFETPGDADVPLAPAGALFYDSLPLALRGLDFERTGSGAVKVIDSVFSNQPRPPRIEDARLEVSRAPGPNAAYRVTLNRGARRDLFEFEPAFPHRLMRWDRSDGGSLRLTSSRRLRYWERIAPGDETLFSPPATP